MAPEIPVQQFTYSRKSGGAMVTEHSDLAAAGLLPRNAIPAVMTVVGVKRNVVYGRADHKDVYDASHEDVVAWVYVPVHPAHQSRFPELHLLND